MSTAVPMPEGATKPEEEVPWWMKYAGRGLGTFGGVGRRSSIFTGLIVSL